jgi:hypothetical protein
LNYNLVTIGHDLFGRSLRLLVAHWIWTREDPTFYEREVALGVMELGAPFEQGEVAKELLKLLRLGMIAPTDGPQRDRRGRKYYQRTNSQLWECVRPIGAFLEGQRATRGSSRHPTPRGKK